MVEAFERAKALGSVGAPFSILHRVAGYAHMQLGDFPHARLDIEKSLEVGRARQADFEVALSLRALADLTRLEGAGDEAAAGFEAESREILDRLGVVSLPRSPSTRKGIVAGVQSSLGCDLALPDDRVALEEQDDERAVPAADEDVLLADTRMRCRDPGRGAVLHELRSTGALLDVHLGTLLDGFVEDHRQDGRMVRVVDPVERVGWAAARGDIDDLPLARAAPAEGRSTRGFHQRDRLRLRGCGGRYRERAHGLVGGRCPRSRVGADGAGRRFADRIQTRYPASYST